MRGAAGPRAHFRRELGHGGCARLSRLLRPPSPRLPQRVPALLRLLPGGIALPLRLQAQLAASGEAGSGERQVRPESQPRLRRGTRPFNPSHTTGRSSLKPQDVSITLKTGKTRPRSVGGLRQNQPRQPHVSLPRRATCWQFPHIRGSFDRFSLSWPVTFEPRDKLVAASRADHYYLPTRCLSGAVYPWASPCSSLKSPLKAIGIPMRSLLTSPCRPSTQEGKV